MSMRPNETLGLAALVLIGLVALVAGTVDHIAHETDRATYNGGQSYRQCVATDVADCTPDN